MAARRHKRHKKKTTPATARFALRRAFQRHQHFCRRGAEALTRACVERHSGPAPRVDVQADRRVGLDVRVCCDAGLVTVAVVLPADEIDGRDRADRFEHLGFFIEQRVGGRVDGRLHRKVRHDLQQMVLHDVANRADFLVEASATFDAERLNRLVK